MNDLATMKRLNDAAFARRRVNDTELNRRCSYCGTVETGLVLHSARQRSTVHLKSGNPSATFLVAWFGTNSDTVRDRLVEGYFA